MNYLTEFKVILKIKHLVFEGRERPPNFSALRGWMLNSKIDGKEIELKTFTSDRNKILICKVLDLSGFKTKTSPLLLPLRSFL